MKIGFGAPVSGSWATTDNLVTVANRAEELGYHSLWTFQRLLSAVDGSWGESYRSVQDPLVTMGYLAAITSRIRIGVAVLNMPFFSTALLAKQTATLDILTRGRLDVGLGLGWADEEYAAVGATKEHRGRRGEEFIALLKTLWTADLIDHDGTFYRVPPSKMEPEPLQRPHPPILLGGTAEVALRRAGRLCDGWVSSSRADLDKIGSSIDLVRTAAADAGRDPASLRFVCRGAVRVRPAGTVERRPLVGTLDEIKEDLGALAGQGITELFVDLNFDPEIGSPDADPAASMSRAEEALVALAPSISTVGE